MNRRQRRLAYYVAAFVAVIVAYTLLYSSAMAAFEGKPRSMTESLRMVVQTFTTTGYGEDAANWSTPELTAIVVSMQFTGVFFIFMALPLFVAPWLESRLSTSPPTAIRDIRDHVVICAFTGRSETLVDELTARDISYVVVEADRATATELYEDGVPVVHGDPTTQETLRNVNLRAARAIVADVDDETNASIALAAGQVWDDGDGRIITFLEDPDLANYHRYAGADEVFSPRQLVGESLAKRVTTSVTAEVGDAIEIGEDFEIVELPVHTGADLVGSTIADSGIHERTGAHVIGAWFQGEFVSPPSPDTRIDERTVLLVAGSEAQLEDLKELTQTQKRRLGRGLVFIGGYGEVGATVEETVAAAGLPCRVIDTADKEGVDFVGDITEKSVLLEAGIEEATTMIIALPSDTHAIFATLVARQLDPEVEILARANDPETVQKLYRAGADYVLALSTVSGRMLASTILDEDVISFDRQVEVLRVDVDALAGQTLGGADVRAKTGVTILAVERDDDVITDLDASFRFEAGDSAIVTGPDEGITEFTTLVSE